MFTQKNVRWMYFLWQAFHPQYDSEFGLGESTVGKSFKYVKKEGYTKPSRKSNKE